jgi:hypothetical protein
MRILSVLTLLAATLLPYSTRAEELDFKPMFNGKDLTGWVPVNVAPRTFTVKDGVIHSTGVPTGVMRTERQYENFVIELDWMHEKPAGNAGLFLWGAPLTAQGTPFAKGIEIQILDDAYVTGEAREKNIYTGHGDIFPIHGATMKPDRPHPAGWDRCLPSENRALPAGQWNHYRVEARDGVVKLAVNGKVVSGGTLCNPRKGYLCLESEGSPAQFKNIRIAELPSTNPKPEEIQPLAEDFTSLYTGIDLAGWSASAEHKKHWTPQDWVLHYDGKAAGDVAILKTEKDYGDVVVILDWQLPAPPAKESTTKDAPLPTIKLDLALRGGRVSVPLASSDTKPNTWYRTTATLKGDHLTVTANGQPTTPATKLSADLSARGPIEFRAGDHPVDFASIFVREVK